MTDRELLELAAKAAGFAKAEWQDMTGWGESRYGMSQGIWNGEDYWNPLTDDGDALRLAVKLNIGIQSHADAGEYSFADANRLPVPIVENHNDDPYAATRRAIVRAAAEIGKGMK